VMDSPCFGASGVLVKSELKLGVGIVLCSALSWDMCQVIYRVVIVDPLFFKQYILLLEDMYEE
jgi:hypothetical protein